jgi:ribonuclease VapC
MVIDTSAIIAVIFNEPEAAAISTKLAAAERRLISAATLVEATVVLTRQTKSGDDRDLAPFLTAAPFEIVAFDEEQSVLARDAFRRYGQRSGHPARLNFGDCFAYALAKQRNEPLLFIGRDFSQSDITPA